MPSRTKTQHLSKFYHSSHLDFRADETLTSHAAPRTPIPGLQLFSGSCSRYDAPRTMPAAAIILQWLRYLSWYQTPKAASRSWSRLIRFSGFCQRLPLPFCQGAEHTQYSHGDLEPRRLVLVLWLPARNTMIRTLTSILNIPVPDFLCSPLQERCCSGLCTSMSGPHMSSRRTNDVLLLNRCTGRERQLGSRQQL